MSLSAGADGFLRLYTVSGIKAELGARHHLGANQMNMYQLLEKTASETPDTVFLVRENVTYRDFIGRVKAMALALQRGGVKSGDTVGILARNVPGFPTAMFAVWHLGAIALLLENSLTKTDYERMTELSGAKIVASEPSFTAKLREGQYFDLTADYTPSAESNALVPAELKSENVATLSFTSGSTGTPKIVPLTHFNIVETAMSLRDFKDLIKQGDMFYGFLPM
jgi:long-chain acyl-CoA synthetase